MKLLPVLVAVTLTCTANVYGQSSDWEKQLQEELPLLGHRNWIVVADSAYPAQTAPGIRTVYTGAEQLDAVRKVLAAVEEARHVRGTVFVDAELPHVPEEFAGGISEYRDGLEKALDGQQVTRLPHGEIIEQLDEAGQTFRVLLLKTDLTLPYTSVFIRLDCGYWSDDAEKQLRKAIEAADPSQK
ncbi:hypothetical protein Mal4_02710 [Maioricimonas rarisocia]|uniref:D-ribose pyranase n=1 Tax=Maioricimonas rarisocia TaxID=2528026 RepID=A0A517Z0I7_9PLAN|nr:hypothetical protein [Maioricimonas rarisocia]QDU35988.1 hypothetical protein Mal4_02710 [Maioricimonas rarisocia]